MTDQELFKAATKFFINSVGTMAWFQELGRARSITKTSDVMAAIVADYRASTMHRLKRNNTASDLALYINTAVNQ